MLLMESTQKQDAILPPDSTRSQTTAYTMAPSTLNRQSLLDTYAALEEMTDNIRIHVTDNGYPIQSR